MAINIKNLRISDIGKRVVYCDWGDKKEIGIISSWNKKFIFVRFSLGDTSASCDPKYLNFL